jgi:hypothetical protein
MKRPKTIKGFLVISDSAGGFIHDITTYGRYGEYETKEDAIFKITEGGLYKLPFIECEIILGKERKVA